MLRTLLVSTLLLVPAAEAAQVYVCKDDAGRTLYSQTPCPQQYSDRSVKNVEIEPGLSFEDSQAKRAEAAQSVSENNDRISLERMISKASETIERLTRERDALITEKQGLAASLGGPNAAQRGKAIIDDLNASLQDYQNRINQQIQMQTDGSARLESLNSDR